ncbi:MULTISPECIES: WD40 repeat domain-containing protein [unclassified Microcoleus]
MSKILEGHSNFVRSLAISQHSETLVSGSDREIVVWGVR